MKWEVWLLCIAMSLCSGCTGTQAGTVTELSCAVVRKLCMLAGGACAIVDPTSGGETTQP